MEHSHTGIHNWITIIRYIQNQEKHHAAAIVQERIHVLLRKFDIAFEEKYVFKFIE